MNRTWTFGQRITGGLAVIVALTLIIAAVSVFALRSVVSAKDVVITVHAENIADGERMALAAARGVSAVRGYLLTRQESQLEEVRARREAFRTTLAVIRARAVDPDGTRMLEEVERREADLRVASDRVIDLRRADGSLDVVARRFEEEVIPRREAMNQAADAYINLAQRALEQEKRNATEAANSVVALVLVITALSVVFAFGIALVLTRTLRGQIGTAVNQVQSSSTELQAAAGQQATGARQQATAMAEITTTINELLATSRQISESAQRVAQIAEQTAAAARSGDATVERGHQAVAGIRRQVDLIVTHMLDMGRKSQQTGAVLEIVSELAEQTNILAINATIEAAGAGEAGRRFGVVADEIRKLADRVAGSTKEVRGLIDDVRSAVNTTVMTTESGSKAVDTGSQQFAEVASAFRQIRELVSTTTEAAREIELSTKQQTTAVEQVNVAVTNVAQASRESEASTGQTLQTAAQLSGLSRALLRLVQPASVGPNNRTEGSVA